MGIEFAVLTGGAIDEALCRCGGRIVVVRSIVGTGSVGVWGSDATGARSEDEFYWGSRSVLDQEHVAAGALEQEGEDDRGWCGAVFAEDVFVADAAGDLHSGLTGDVAENLVETGVVGSYGELAVGVTDLGAMSGRYWLGLWRLGGYLRLSGRAGGGKL